MVERLKIYFNKYFSNGPKVIIGVFLVILVSLVAIVYNSRKVVTVCIGDKQMRITTFSSNYKKALENNHIVLGPKDKTTPSLDGKVVDKGKITVKKAVNVEVKVDGKKLNIESAEDNVQKMLTAEKIKVNKSDEVNPVKSQPLRQGLTVVVTRLETKDIKGTKPIGYETVVKKDSTKEQGNNQVLQDGQSGEKEVVTRVLYRDGKEISRKIISEVVKRQPVQKIIAVGTLGAYTPSRGGKILYRNAVSMRATGYSAGYESTGKSPGDSDFGITASGTVARRSINGYSSVAVDPRIIPLGTKLYVEGYGYAIAEDTGGAIKGNRVDLFFDSASEANVWGVRNVNVYIIS
ncbi:DUF348 domain-containing protein [Clostridium fermenticellae]|uniref:DUF348 domain-containing protein n=1 Tax=Clostridium fermenticellae TaxID=2068654 RepID=A0A386H0M9_9CLOT|nr:3D domain-containing protein [Clostridium fermenticellae]AYD39133.1 DUF348 domain-containing protein [Clostridium fermenticellae]